jgi:hypothetical protein
MSEIGNLRDQSNKMVEDCQKQSEFLMAKTQIEKKFGNFKAMEDLL